MCMEKSLWEKAISFHGHVCPGLAVGYRVSEMAMKWLQETRSVDEDLVAVVENDACGVDAVMLVTGCTLGKGNLIYRNTGKQVYTFGSRNSKRALRISVNGESLHLPNPEYEVLRSKVFGGSPTREEKDRFQYLQGKRTDEILHMHEDQLLKLKEIEYVFPVKARIFPSVKCSACGEYAMEPRVRIKNGAHVCMDCFDEYSRGW